MKDDTINTIAFNLTRAVKMSFELDTLMKEISEEAQNIDATNDVEGHLEYFFNALRNYKKSAFWISQALTSLLAARDSRNEEETTE